MRKFRLLILFLILTNLVFAKKLADLPEVLFAPYVDLHQNRIYIYDLKTIHIYSLKDFTHLKQFGKEGEGPGEYNFLAILSVCQDRLILNTRGKLIFFTLDGSFIEEYRVPHRIGLILPVRNNFVGKTSRINFKTFKGETKVTIAVYDKKFKLIKNIYQRSRKIGGTRSGDSKKVDLLMDSDHFSHDVYKERIYIGDTSKGFFFSVFNSEGKKLYEVNREYKKLKVTEDYKKGVLKSIREGPYGEKSIKMYKFIFPEYFPAYRDIRFSDDKIYFVTYGNVDQKDEVIVTDLQGKFLRKTSIPSDPYDRIRRFSIYNDKVYYLEENEEEEMWELHAEDLK